MSEDEDISFYFSVLKIAEGIVRDIEERKTKYQIIDLHGQASDATDAIRDHESQVIEILHKVLENKDRRKSPRS